MITLEQYNFLSGKWPTFHPSDPKLIKTWDECLDLGYFTFEGKLTLAGEEAVKEFDNDNH